MLRGAGVLLGGVQQRGHLGLTGGRRVEHPGVEQWSQRAEGGAERGGVDAGDADLTGRRGGDQPQHQRPQQPRDLRVPGVGVQGEVVAAAERDQHRKRAVRGGRLADPHRGRLVGQRRDTRGGGCQGTAEAGEAGHQVVAADRRDGGRCRPQNASGSVQMRASRPVGADRLPVRRREPAHPLPPTPRPSGPRNPNGHRRHPDSPARTCHAGPVRRGRTPPDRTRRPPRSGTPPPAPSPRRAPARPASGPVACRPAPPSRA
ncbi:Vegetative cell wall protein gp1 [Micromonospora saelicesensis]|uniref:Vegetative cell wall protein gp1 n=1 Tax=Micromonospora saelicesensis TaxID=285676 RepID=A0ABX9CS94_9ACTN|nr:Vegetative cell wall protein gp1 [Micromonospora saelicesensis]